MPTIMIARTKYLLAIPAVLFLLVLLLYFRLTDVTSFLIERELHAAGFTDITLDIQAITATRGSITTLRARHPAGDLQADGITLHYTPAQLLNARVDAVEIASLQLALHTQHATSDTFALPVLASDWLTTLPFNRAQITQARLELPTAIQAITHIDIQADITRSDDMLDAQVILAAASRPRVMLHLTAGTGHAVTFTIKDQATATPALTLQSRELVLSPDTLHTALTIDVDLRSLRPLGTHWFPDITLPEITDAFHASGTLALSVANQQPRAELRLSEITVTLPDNIVRLDHMAAQAQISPDKINATANVQAADGKLVLDITAQHDRQQQQGSAMLVLQPASLDAASNIPGKLLHRWPYPVHIASGTLGSKTSIRWQQQRERLALEQTTHVSLDNLSGRIRQIPFNGLRGNLTVSGIDRMRITSRDGVRLTSIDPGVAITDMRLRANVLRQTGKAFVIRLQRFEASTLGGTLSADNTLVDLNRNTNRLTLNVQGLDIAELIKLEQKETLHGTGKLNGALPIILGRDGLRMSAGTLAAQPPYGVIRYRGDERLNALAANNQNVDILVKALSDFHYHLLEAELDYAPDGQLQAKVRLQGKNPELEGGRPVHLNINLEENVLTLLRSLQLADDISRKIGEGIKQGINQGKQRP